MSAIADNVEVVAAGNTKVVRIDLSVDRLATLDGLLQHRAHLVVQPRDAGGRKPTSLATGADTRTVEDLVCVDVADAGDRSLVEERRLNRRAATGEPSAQRVVVEGRIQRVGTQTAELGHLLVGAFGIEDHHFAKRAWIDETELIVVGAIAPGLEREHHVRVGRARLVRGRHEDAATHAEVNHDGEPRVKRAHEVLAVAPCRDNCRPRQTVHE
jgi:hypothetical protein